MRNRAARARVGGVLAPRDAGAPRRRLARLRQAVAATGVVAVGAVAACIDDRGLGPRPHDPVRLALGVAVAQAGALASPNIQAEIFYLRSPEAGAPDRRRLATITQNVAPTTTQITLRVDIAPCLGDPGHLATPTGGYEGEAAADDPMCDLEVELTFRDGATALDQAVVSVSGVKPGEPATAPGGVRLVAAGALELSPSAIAVGIDQAVELTATVRDRDGAALA